MTVQLGDGDERDVDDHDDTQVESDNQIESDEAEDLTLVEDDEPLPWLESDYDEEDEGVDTGRIIGFALLSLLLLALILGTFWWFSNRGPDPDLVADGGTIEAPDGPIKERPEDAGGKTFEGTGNVAPSVGEGESREGRLAQGNTPRSEVDTGTNAATGEPAASSTGVGVQIGAFSNRQSAVTGWNTLRGQTDALKGFKYRVEEGKADIGTVYRLQAVANDAAAANRLCGALKADGIACQVKR